jgi:PST family polysaccharide transporter
MVVYYANNFTNFGFNNALVQHSDISRRHINSVFTLDLFISVFLAVCTFCFSRNLSEYFHVPELERVLRWMSFYFVVTTFYYIPVAILRRSIEFRFLAVITFAQSVAVSLSSIVLAAFGMSYWSIVIPALVVPVLVCPFIMLKAQWYPRIFYSHSDMKEIYGFGIWNFIRTQFNLLVSKVDYFVIGRYLDVFSLGIYQKSFELSERALTGLSTPVNGIFFSTFSRIKHDFKQVKQVFLEASSLLTFFCYPVLFGLIAVSDHFIYSCLGVEWKEAVIPIRILASACLLRTLLGMVASVNVSVGKYKKHTLMKMISAFFFIGICFLVIRQGIIAICWAFLLFSVVEFFGSFWIISQTISVSIKELIVVIWCPFTGSMLMYAIVRIASRFLWSDLFSLIEFVYLVVIGILVYGIWSGVFYKLGVIQLKISDAEE